ncbi:hypothetical protein AWB94_08335 [Mycolicibacterium canariasense]|nr:hypothetical protein AWB94_08335 [Mycolicibacterium canariasense]
MMRWLRYLGWPSEHLRLLGFLLVKRRAVPVRLTAWHWAARTASGLPGILRIHVFPPMSRGAMSCPAPSVASIIA